MALILENAFLQLTINPVLGRWSLTSRQRNGPLLENAQLSLLYRKGYAHVTALDRWPYVQAAAPEQVPSVHGPLHQVALSIGPDPAKIHCQLVFALPEDHPFLMWRLVVENRSRQPIFIDKIELLSAGFVYQARSGPRGTIRLYPTISGRGAPRRSEDQHTQTAIIDYEPAFYANGWQSWSYSGVYGVHERFRRNRLSFLAAPMWVNAGTPQPAKDGLYASDMFGVLGDRANRNALLAGFLSQKQHFGSLECWANSLSPALRLWANGDGARLESGRQVATDWAYLQFLHLDDPDPLGAYLEAVERENGCAETLQGNRAAITGWCSWYQFYKNVTPSDIRQNLVAAVQLNPDIALELIQIDDGFEAQVGDWFAFDQAFHEGVAPLAAEIRSARKGMPLTPGLWLAPFILHPGSRLASEHPDWLLRGRLGRPTNAGLLWGSFANALDLTHPQALDYTRQLVATAVGEWGFPYLKLDFLYAAALPGRHRDPTRTRAQVLRAALEALRAAAGKETFLLGCGCPLGPAIGLVDGMRISTDVDERWKPAYHGVEFYFREDAYLPSARNAVHNALTRAPMHRRWWINDPDCLLLRPSTRLTQAEVHSLATVIALCGGVMLLSDNLPELPPERLHIAEVLLPLIDRRPHLLDWFDSPTPCQLQLDLQNPAGGWALAALFNWADQPRDLVFRLRDFYLDTDVEHIAREFWSGAVWRIPAWSEHQDRPPGGELTLSGVPAHGVRLLAVRPYRPYLPQYLGSDLHISQGLEVTGWKASPQGLCLSLERPGRAKGIVELSLPHPPCQAMLDSQAIEWQDLEQGRYRFPVNFNRTARLQIGW
jgi:alpha-galactosidase